ncbi:MAG: transferase hexapeptide repeat family protein [Saprospirales bacterium]|nr:MAG: transferase hexapeptide repeat family protein [Saprospirales bacterium]
MIYSFDGFVPVVHPTAYIHQLAAVTGNVTIGKNVYIAPGAAIRGDWGEIIIEDGCNVQENCTIHMFPGVSVILRESAHIGHGAVIHGAEIGKNSLVGMNAVVMDEAVIGQDCIIGALSFIKAGEKVPDRSLMVGNPAKRIKSVSDEMIRWKTEGTKIYQQLPEDMRNTTRETKPLKEVPKNRPTQKKFFQTWKKRKEK